MEMDTGLIDKLLADYQKPEDLIGENWNQNRHGQHRSEHSTYAKGNFDLQSRLAVDCRLAEGPAGLKCYGES